MNSRYVAFISFVLLLASFNAFSADEDYLSPVDIIASKDGKTLYVAQYTAKKVALLDAKSLKVTKAIDMPGRPSNLCLSPSESLLYVSCAEPAGTVQVVALNKNKIIKSIKVGHTPMSPVVSPDGNTLYVCNRHDNDVSVIDIASGKELKRIKMTREPIAAAITPDGKSLYVANHLPTGAANVDHMTSRIDVIDTASATVATSISLPNGAIDLRRICVSGDGKNVYVPSILARFMVPTTQIERGWINTHALNIIDAEQRKLLHTVLLDDVDQGAANPWGVVCTPDDKYICVAHSATHEVSVIDRAALNEKLSKVPVQEERKDDAESTTSLAYNPVNDLSFLTGVRVRIKIKGNGPRGITAAGGKVYFAEYFSDSIGSLKYDPDENPDVESVTMGKVKPMDKVRLGEMYFNDASLCFQQWQSCATCHPDARTDAVNWDLLNDGIGNPKSTKSMLYSMMTPPVMITGVRDKAETAVRAGIRYIQFAVPEEDKATAIDAYLMSLRPIPSPRLVNGKLSKLAEKGEKVFDKAGCSSCHSGKYYTDMEKYDVGTADGMEEGKEFDTPMLIEIWRTAPYLYDGRAASLKDVFTTFNKSNSHGTTSKLKESELDALIEYVLSL